MSNPEPGRLPTLHVIGDTIPQAYYRAIKAVWKHGALMSTQYDRRDDYGNLIDPPGRDARVMIEIKQPFAQPRYPPISFCEIGTYIAELMGVKDHRVIPMSVLKKMIAGAELGPEEQQVSTYWPYTYHQRLFNHPDTCGDTVDQMALAVEKVIETPFTRRAIASTAVPNIDSFLKEDVPCLREVQLRALEVDDRWILNPTLTWRSRDLYKAWGDNVIGLTFLLQKLVKDIRLQERYRLNCELGSYAEFSMSLHIYGQDFSAVGGNKEKGLAGFFETFPTEDDFINRSYDSETAADMFVVPQLTALKSPESIKAWEFPQKSIEIIDDLLAEIKAERLIV